MKIPPYWVTGRCEVAGMCFRLHGSSDTSIAEARSRLAAREQLFRRYHEEQSLPLAAYRDELTSLLRQEKGDTYEVELFEPLLERVGEQSIITRNRYGVEVLNTTELCMVDVDAFPPSRWERLASLLGGRLRSDEERLRAALQRLSAEDPGLSARLYRTAGGWRVILVAEGLAPGSPRMEQLERRLCADPLYASLCCRQQCWRARLTPKPGRLHAGLGRFPRRMASDTPAEGEADWLARYGDACQNKGVCRLVACFGAEIRHPLMALHDERTQALLSGLPLA